MRHRRGRCGLQPGLPRSQQRRRATSINIHRSLAMTSTAPRAHRHRRAERIRERRSADRISERAKLARQHRPRDGCARAAGVPVVVVQNFAPGGSPIFARGSDGAELHPVVASREHDHYVEKSLPSAFTGTDLAEWLTARQIDTLTVAGYMTHNCDASTINHAVHAGLTVEFLHDATGPVPYENSAGFASAEDIHRVFCVVLQSRFAAVASTDEWLAAVKAACRWNAAIFMRRIRKRAAGTADSRATDGG